jgi:hypothetical protein
MSREGRCSFIAYILTGCMHWMIPLTLEPHDKHKEYALRCLPGLSFKTRVAAGRRRSPSQSTNSTAGHVQIKKPLKGAMRASQ